LKDSLLSAAGHAPDGSVIPSRHACSGFPHPAGKRTGATIHGHFPAASCTTRTGATRRTRRTTTRGNVLSPHVSHARLYHLPRPRRSPPHRPHLGARTRRRLRQH